MLREEGIGQSGKNDDERGRGQSGVNDDERGRNRAEWSG
jgi:hypothetical protein